VATVYTQVIKLPKNLEKPHPVRSGHLSLQVRKGKDFSYAKSEGEVFPTCIYTVALRGGGYNVPHVIMKRYLYELPLPIIKSSNLT
jgi:hypothetical protein